MALRAAASTAYFHITGAGRQVSGEAALAEILPLVAIALSAVAPILRDDGRPLSDRDVNQLLFRRKAGPGALDELRMRRGDLRKAMELLRQAHISFGRER